MNKKADLAFWAGIILVVLSVLILVAGLNALSFNESGIMYYVAPFASLALFGSAFILFIKAEDMRNVSNRDNEDC